MESGSRSQPWCPEEEKILSDLSNSCSVLKELYRSIYTRQKHLQAKFRLPAIMVGSISGACSFGTTTFPQQFREYVSIAVGAASLFIAILSTIESYLQVGQRLSQANSTTQALNKLMLDIRRELMLPLQDRETSGVIFVRDCHTRFAQIIEQSPTVDRDDIRSNYRLLKHNAVGIPELLSITRLEAGWNKTTLVPAQTEQNSQNPCPSPSYPDSMIESGELEGMTPAEVRVAIKNLKTTESGTPPLEIDRNIRDR